MAVPFTYLLHLTPTPALAPFPKIFLFCYSARDLRLISISIHHPLKFLTPQPLPFTFYTLPHPTLAPFLKNFPILL